MPSNKIIIFTTITSLSIASYNNCMDEPKTTIQQYQLECEKIIAQQKTKLESYKTTQINKNIAQQKAVFENKLGQCQMLLDGQKEVFLARIEQQLNVDKTMWQACMKIIDDIKQFNKTNQHLPLPNVFHDASIPAFPLLLITERLKKAGINPQRINIYGKTNTNFLYSCTVPMPCLYRLETECSKKEKMNMAPFIISPENVRPGEVILNLDILKDMYPVDQGALCVRIVEDMIQNTNLLSSIITSFEPLLVNQIGSITHSKQFKELSAFYTGKLTVLQPSLNNPTTASCMLQLLLSCFHPDFTSQDYKLLAKIDRYWKSLTWIAQQQ